LFTEAILGAAHQSIPRGRRLDYKPFWTSELDKLQNQMNEARETMEENPSEKIPMHKQLRKRFDEEKAEQTRKSWHEKTAYLNLEKDTTKLWHIIKLLNDDNRQQKKTVLLVDGEPVTGKEAVNVFAKAYEAESSVNLPQERVRHLRQEAKILKENHRENEVSPYMSDRLTMHGLQAALKKLKKKKSPGADGITNEMLKQLGHRTKNTLRLQP